MYRRNSILLISILSLISLGSAASVGVSPGFVDVGEVQRGQAQEFNFYITTNMNEEFQLSPSYRATTKFVGLDYGISMDNVSEQDIGDWIEFTEETYTIDPTTSETYQLPDGSAVNAEGVLTAEVDVPPNAEPGYRVGQLGLNPSISGKGSGAGARVFAQTVPGIAFRVPGNVNRDISVAGVQAVRIGENKVQLIFQLRNTGTTTTGFRGGEVEVRRNGQSLGKVNLDPATLAPGEYAEVDATWGSDSVEGGEYELEGTGDYLTGETYISSNFVIQDVIQERQSIDEPSGGEVEEQNNAPLTMIIIISLLIGTLLYLLDIELTWIIMLAGGTAIALYILLSSTTNVLVLIPLLSIAVMLYV